MAEIEDAETRDAIVMWVASGKSFREAAREFMTNECTVRQVIKEEAERACGGEYMREMWFLESRRLHAAGLKCYNKGMAGAGDATALGIYVKLVERHAVLAGANMPATHVVNVTTSTAPIARTSTDELKLALDRLSNYAPREQELEDKDWHKQPMTADELQELDDFRAVRDRKRIEELERKEREREERKLARANGEGTE